ncbi:MAG: hypothetical protein R3344_07575 [Acidobacteriota bacterium]|nr:hypothetical protein [Acidobacteriota bacterium]
MSDRKPAHLLAGVAVLATCAVAGSSDGAPVDGRFSITLAEVDEALAPVELDGLRFTVVVHRKKLVWPEETAHRFDRDDDETAVSFDVCDDDGKVLYTYDVLEDPTEIELARVRREGRFPSSYAVHPYLLQGSSGSALMVDWSFFPSAPGTCTNHVVLGIVDGRLVPFGEPFCESLEAPRELTATVWPLKRNEQTGDDTLEVRRNTGYFSVIVPVRVGFSTGQLLPLRRCLRLNEEARWVELCELPVDAYRRPAGEETFVRLSPRPDRSAMRQHVVIEPDSEVEFLSALAPGVFDENGVPNPPAGEQPPWLKVRIGDKEGWVRDDEDLSALGLRPVG